MHHVPSEESNLTAAESEIITSIENVMLHTTDTRYDLLFTPTKIVAAIVLHPSDLVQLYSKRFDFEQLVIGGAMQMHQIQAMTKKIENERRQGFKYKTPTEILGTHYANFEILFSNILSAKVVRGLFGVGLEFDAYINEKRKRIKFKIDGAEFETVKELLHRTMPDKMV